MKGRTSASYRRSSANVSLSRSIVATAGVPPRMTLSTGAAPPLWPARLPQREVTRTIDLTDRP